MQEHSSLRRRLFVLLLAGYTCAAWSQQSPCPFYPPPTVKVNPDVELVPQQPVALSSLLEITPDPGRLPAWIGMCVRRGANEKDLWDLTGVAWQKPVNQNYEIACMDVAGTPVASVGGSYGTHVSGVNIVFKDKAREKLIVTNQWGTSYALVGDDISFGAWACPGPFTVAFPVGFDPTLAVLNAQSLWPNRTSSVSEKDVLDASQQLHNGFASQIVADETSAAVVVYRVGKFFNEPVTFRLEGSGVPLGTLKPFDPSLLTNAEPGPRASVTIQPEDFKEFTDSLGQKTKFAFAVYRAPAPRFQRFSDIGKVTVTAVNYEDERQVELPVVAPPVILLHGLWGTLETFASWPDGAGGSYYPNYKFVRLMYDGSKSFRDIKNQEDLLRRIVSLQDEMRQNGVVGSRVDIVSHSMGGLMTRQFLASAANTSSREDGGAKLYNTSPIYRFVTLDTPHLGSPLASFLWENRDAQLSPLRCLLAAHFAKVQLNCEAGSDLGTLFGATKRRIDTAIQDMGSKTFNSLSLASPAEASGGYLSVSSSVGATDALALTLDGAFQLIGEHTTTVGAIFADAEDPENDAIVGVKSQEKYKDVSAAQLPRYARNHIEITNDPEVKGDVLCFLSQGACLDSIGQRKPQPPKQRKTLSGPEWDLDLSGMTRSNYAATPILTDAPLQQGMLGSMYLTVSGKAIKAAYLAFESSLMDREFFYQVQPWQGYDWIRFSNLPVLSTDSMRATMLILFDDNTYGIYKKSFPVVTAPVSNYSQVRLLADHVSLEVGDTATVELTGNGAAGPALLSASSFTLKLDSGSDVISLGSDGLITALKEGRASFTVSNADTGLSLVGTVSVGNAAEPVVAAPKIAVSGVEFINQAPTVALTTAVNVPVSASFTLSNAGTAELQIGAITWQVTPGATSIQSNSCTNAKLAAGASCVVTLRFAPTANGTYEGLFAIATNDPHYQNLPIHFIGTASAPIVYGTATVSVTGVSCSGTVGQVTTCAGNPTIKATGGTVILAAIPTTLSGNNASEFKVAAGNCSGVTLASDESCTLGSVTFTAGAPGTRTAALRSSVSQGTLGMATLSGTGTAAPVDNGVAIVQVSGVSCSGTVGQASACAGAPVIKAVGGPVKLNMTPVLTEGPQAAEFVVGSGTCAGASLAKDASCTLGQVMFTAGAAGTRSALITSSVVEGSSAGTTLTGTGNEPAGGGSGGGSGGAVKGVATVSVEGMSCSGTVGQAATCTGTPTIKASGGVVSLAATPVTIEGAQAAEFSVAVGSCAGASLAAEASCSLGQVTFTAGAAGTRSATLSSVVTDGTTASATLTGIGSANTGGNGGNGGTGGTGGNNSGGGGGGSIDLRAAALLLMFGVLRIASGPRRRHPVPVRPLEA